MNEEQRAEMHELFELHTLSGGITCATLCSLLRGCQGAMGGTEAPPGGLYENPEGSRSHFNRKPKNV